MINIMIGDGESRIFFTDSIVGSGSCVLNGAKKDMALLLVNTGIH